MVSPSPARRTAPKIEKIPFDADAVYAGLQTAPTGEPGYGFLERLWLRPTLDVNGMWGGYTGEGSKTVIPNEARAKLTMRLVPGQDPDRVQQAVMTHLEQQCPKGATVSLTGTRGAAGAYMVPPNHPLLLAAERALKKTTGNTPQRVRIGATLPLSEIVRRVLSLDTVMFSFATADEDYHAPNEFLRSTAIDEGLAAWITILREVGHQDPATYTPFRA